MRRCSLTATRSGSSATGCSETATPQGSGRCCTHRRAVRSTMLSTSIGALPTLLPHLVRRPLLVASKGVARALGEILGQPAGASLSNGELSHFDLTHFGPLPIEGCQP